MAGLASIRNSLRLPLLVSDMSSGQEHLIQQQLALHAVIVALCSLLVLHDDADTVDLSATMKDGRLDRMDVNFAVKGRALGGFGQ